MNDGINAWEGITSPSRTMPYKPSMMRIEPPRVLSCTACVKDKRLSCKFKFLRRKQTKNEYAWHHRLLIFIAEERVGYRWEGGIVIRERNSGLISGVLPGRVSRWRTCSLSGCCSGSSFNTWVECIRHVTFETSETQVSMKKLQDRIYYRVIYLAVVTLISIGLVSTYGRTYTHTGSYGANVAAMPKVSASLSHCSWWIMFSLASIAPDLYSFI